MAITFDATANINNIGTPGTSVSGSHTMSGSANGVVWVFVTWNAGTVSAMTYGGNAMVFAYTTTSATGVNMSAYYYINPASGSNTVAFTVSSSATIVMFVSSYVGVNRVRLLDGNTLRANTTGNTTLNTSLTTIITDDWVIGYSRGNAAITLAGAGFTSRLTQSGVVLLADTNGGLSANTTSTFTTTQLSGTSVGVILIAMCSAGAVGSTSNFFHGSSNT